MKYLLFAIICLASSLMAQRPWDPEGLNIEFDIRHDFSGGVYGDKIEGLNKTISDLNNLKNSLSGIKNPTMFVVVNSLSRLKALDKLSDLKNNGGKSDFNGSFNLRLHNIIARDCISFDYSYRSETGSSPKVVLEDLLGYRLFDSPSYVWLNDLDVLLQASIASHPGLVYKGYTKQGEAFENNLVNLGYPRHLAGFLTYMCEKAGINFNGFTAKLISNVLENQLFDMGSTVDDIYSILERSGVNTTSLITQTYSIGYNVCLTDYFRIGCRANYLRVSNDTSFMSVGEIRPMAMVQPRKPVKERAFFTADAFFSITPIDRFFIDLSLFNIGANHNSGKRMQGHIDIGYDGDIFKCGVGVDTNAVPDACFKWLHYQYLTTYIGIEPDYEKAGVGFRVTARKNAGDSDEPVLVGLSTSLTLWFVKISGGGESALNFTQLKNLSIPDRFNWHVQISVNIQW